MADTNANASAPEIIQKAQSEKTKPQNIVKISDIIGIALKNWYWILIFLLLSLGCAWLYIRITVPRYVSSTQVMISSDAQTAGGTAIDLEEIGIKTGKTFIDDEMIALRSPDLMETVVNKLNLDVDYLRPGTFHDTPIFGSDVPVLVSFPDTPVEDAVSLDIEVSPKGKITVSNLKVNNQDMMVNPNTPVEFGKAIATRSGNIIIEKSPFFREGEEVKEIVRKLPLKAAVAKYTGEINVTNTVKGSNVVDITCSDANPTRGTEILSALIEAYNQDWINGKAQVVAATNKFITERLNAVESELSGVDSNISSFKSSHLIPDLNASATADIQNRLDAGNQAMAINNQLQMARYLRNYVTTEGKNQVLPLNTGLTGSGIDALINEYNGVMIRRNEMIGNSSESNPMVQEYDSRLAALRRTIIASIDNSVLSLSANLRDHERTAQSATARVAANPVQAKIILSNERKQKVQESLYLYLLQKREENELSQAYIKVNTRVIRRAAPGGQTAPQPAQAYLIALVVGLCVPVGAIYALESMNTKVRGRKDVEHLSIPIIGEIPKFKRTSHVSVAYFDEKGKQHKRSSSSMKEDIVVEEGNRNIVNEAFRVLRTNVSFITADSLPTVVMLTSFNPGSGKTFITVNLGISLALKKHKVLLVDCDLRRASLSRFVGSPSKGLAEYLAGKVHDVDSIIRRDSIHEGLDLLPVGTIPPNPTELLESKRFSNLVEYLRSEYDFVLIDCPPAEMMADAQIVGACSDRTFFVVRVGLLERQMLDRLDQYYEEKKYPGMSLILNDSVTGTRYGYTYRYGYGYYGNAYSYKSNYYSKD